MDSPRGCSCRGVPGLARCIVHHGRGTQRRRRGGTSLNRSGQHKLRRGWRIFPSLFCSRPQPTGPRRYFADAARSIKSTCQGALKIKARDRDGKVEATRTGTAWLVERHHVRNARADANDRSLQFEIPRKRDSRRARADYAERKSSRDLLRPHQIAARRCPRLCVDISSDDGRARLLFKRVENFRIPHIASMDDEIGTAEGPERLVTQKTMRIRDQANQNS